MAEAFELTEILSTHWGFRYVDFRLVPIEQNFWRKLMCSGRMAPIHDRNSEIAKTLAGLRKESHSALVRCEKADEQDREFHREPSLRPGSANPWRSRDSCGSRAKADRRRVRR